MTLLVVSVFAGGVFIGALLNELFDFVIDSIFED